MANIASAKTRINRNAKRQRINSDRLSAVRTAVKKTRSAILTGNKEVAQTCFRAAESALMAAAGKGTIHKKNASRKVSRLAAALKKM
ncbi:MAG: 30S ribosomal protein S20 [Alphaproteobacteria bacterium]|nr:30S ribosomal protein S20 [Alphaproteobacteria bacterium]MBQ9090443.1 30S ribosomal protein S20 [Alphaproteobacteria bacterium]